MTVSVKDTALALSELKTNERAWFWLCTDASPALILLPASAPGGVGALRQMAGEVSRGGAAPQFAGIAAITEGGQLRLCAQRLTRDGLEGLAKWVSDNRADSPSLARATNAALICTGPRGEVVETFEDASLWHEPVKAEPLPPIPGSLEECGAYVQAMVERGGSAWVWMSASGPGNAPAAVVLPTREDRKGQDFVGRVRAVMQRAGRPCPGIIGVLRCSGRGQSLLLTKSDVSQVDGLRTALVQQAPGFSVLQSTWLLQMGAKPAARAPGEAPARDLSAQAMALSTLRPNQTIWFWLQSDSQGTHVELAATRPMLKQSTREHRREGATSVMGKLRLNERQIPTFLARSRFDGFITALAGWVADNHSDWPALLRLLGARMMVKDRDGNVLDRQKDAAAWEKVR